MVGWCLNLAYVLAALLFAPVLLYRRVRHGKYREGWSQKLLGRLPMRTGDAPCLWLHAVSVGEVLLLRPVIESLRRSAPGVEIWISTTTQTGQAVARASYPDCRTVYFPLDFTWAVASALRRVRPTLVALVELELWPNFIEAVQRQGVPLVLVNGRISERSARGYRRIRPLIARRLAGFQRLLVQTVEYADRLRELGAPAERIVVTGSVKFDGVTTSRDNPATRRLREQLALPAAARIIVAGSTHAPEEEYVLDAYTRLRQRHPDLWLIVVPRHQERFEEVAAAIVARGFAVRRRSQALSLPPSRDVVGSMNRTGTAPPPVILLDTLGELSACWGLADVAFVGGSLTQRGGQNMIEPAACGAAVLFGPHTRNFRHAVDLLLSRNAARIVSSPEELTGAIDELLSNSQAAIRLGRAAQEVVHSQQGATAATVQELLIGLGVSRSLCRAA